MIGRLCLQIYRHFKKLHTLILFTINKIAHEKELMNKKNYYFFFQVFVLTSLVWLTICLTIHLLSGCRIAPSLISNTQTVGTPRAYIHYAQSQEFNIPLEFDYPSSWVLVELPGIISLLDPQNPAVQIPPPVLEGSHSPSDDSGSVTIIVKRLKLDHTLDTEVETYKQNNTGTNSVIFLRDHKITVDGYEARVVESQFGPDELYASLMFNKVIFLVVGDQAYRIDFTVAERDRGGEFEKGYEYFLDSLKIVP